MKDERVYVGVRGSERPGDVEVYVVESDHRRELAHYPYHSPTGVEWGFSGSGPADLAIAILADVLGETPTREELDRGAPRCWRLHQDFKAEYIATAPEEGLWITASEVEAWIAAREGKHPDNGEAMSMDGLREELERIGALEPEPKAPGKLPIEAPPMLDRALGYEGDGEWVSFWWESGGDELMYDDGRVSADGEWDAWLLWIHHRTVAPHLVGYDFGSSDEPEKHRLLLHRPTRSLYAVTPTDAGRTVFSYWQARGLPQFTPDELESTLAEWEHQQEEWRREPQALDRHIREQMEAHVWVMGELALWLDSQHAGNTAQDTIC